ncbi:MAG: polyprenyl glycosylphosphotransferase [Candidatus Parcubacteria bacterium]|nr:MAG: polyprenyl glycosylphosphotransferase [Candidatus Parcubacteria bacterium]
MKTYSKYLKYILIFGDILFFYLSLYITIYTRYGFNIEIFKQHFIGFSFILPFWIIAFYSNNFYSLNILKNKFFLRLIKSFIIGFVFSIIFFYFSPQLKITPKTNLFLFSFIYLAIFIIYRNLFENKFLNKRKIKILVIIPKNILEKFKQDFEGLVIYNFTFYDHNSMYDDFSKFDLIVISHKIFNQDQNLINHVIKKINYQVPIIELIDFYEKNLGRIPLEELDEYWILKEIINPEFRFQSLIKRTLDILLALGVGIICLFLLPIIALAIYLNSPGPIIFRQKRVGKNNKEFTIYKFRTMKNIPDLGIWEKQNDERIFFVGKILRKLHLDELPQVINILIGELSFVGPRPEQATIVNKLEKQIPFYNLRHLISPGITGWTQVNYKKPYNLEETKIKIEYDLYYLKNRNIFLDLLIILKTVFNL